MNNWEEKKLFFSRYHFVICIVNLVLKLELTPYIHFYIWNILN